MRLAYDPFVDDEVEVDLPAGMCEELAAVAAGQGRTVSEVLTDALTEFMDRRDRPGPPEEPAASSG